MERDEKIFFNLPPNKKYYKIEIGDNGIGFNQVNAEKIFEPFVRLHSKSEYEGSGLGLSICKKIADNHDGIIYAEGDENKGSRFTLILPETH
jgi:signal transduction histidine kinase